MKLFYEIPEQEIVYFDAEDIITTSTDVPVDPTEDDERDEIVDDTVSGVTEDPDADMNDPTDGSSSDEGSDEDAPGAGLEENDPTDPPVEENDPTDPPVEENDPTDPPAEETEPTVPPTTAPPMSDGGSAGWGDGDNVDFDDLFGNH